MKSSTTPDFWSAYRNLPSAIRERARRVYRLWNENPRHPSLHFKKVGTLWAIRIGDGYRALAILDKGVYYWIWIGAHDEYERILTEI